MRSRTIAFPVRAEIEGKALQTTSRELGAQWIFVYCAQLPPLHAPVKLRLYLTAGPVELKATVRSVAGQPPGFWADFESPSPEVRARIMGELAATFEQIETPASGAGKFDPTVTGVARNRRALPRLRQRLRVRLDGLETFTADVSETGFFVLADPPPAQDSVVRLALELPDQQPPAEIICVVVRCREGGPPGAALQIVHADDAFRARFNAWLQGIKR
ncbi:MAG TPA: PilZ domain-containing protein [Myxococcales bacterium]